MGECNKIITKDLSNEREQQSGRAREGEQCGTSVEKESKKLVTVVMAVKVKECVKVVW